MFLDGERGSRNVLHAQSQLEQDDLSTSCTFSTARSPHIDGHKYSSVHSQPETKPLPWKG